MILAHTENAESVFSALYSDLLAELKESNTSMHEFVNIVEEVCVKLRKRTNPGYELEQVKIPILLQLLNLKLLRILTPFQVHRRQT